MNDCSQTAGQPPLPELQQSILDPAMVSQLFADIHNCTQVIEVLPKYSAQGYVADKRITLQEGEELYRAGALRALQIRYSYNGSEWWDTLMNTPQGTRIVRIQHDFSGLTQQNNKTT